MAYSLGIRIFCRSAVQADRLLYISFLDGSFGCLGSWYQPGGFEANWCCVSKVEQLLPPPESSRARQHCRSLHKVDLMFHSRVMRHFPSSRDTPLYRACRSNRNSERPIHFWISPFGSSESKKADLTRVAGYLQVQLPSASQIIPAAGTFFPRLSAKRSCRRMRTAGHLRTVYEVRTSKFNGLLLTRSKQLICLRVVSRTPSA